MITAWRLCNKRFAESIGEGARIYGGRWNPIGHAVVYSSECLPLATLEALVHTRRRPNDQVYIQISFDEVLVKEVEVLYSLPPRWNRDEPATQEIGARWLNCGSPAVLQAYKSASSWRVKNYANVTFSPVRHDR
jgi:RES domain-containing protein